MGTWLPQSLTNIPVLREDLSALKSDPHFINLIRDKFFGAAHGWGGGKKAPLPKICRTYSTMMKLGTVTPYLKKIQKIYESRDTPLEFCYFLTGYQQILTY